MNPWIGEERSQKCEGPEKLKQDIEATIRILRSLRKRSKILARIGSFLLLWYPWRGSVQDHIDYLENLLNE